MVTEWFANAISGLFQWLITSVPAPAPPAWFQQGVDFFGAIGGYVSWLDPWAPIDLALAIMGLWVITFVLSIGLKLARQAVSYFTFGGGAT